MNYDIGLVPGYLLLPAVVGQVVLQVRDFGKLGRILSLWLFIKRNNLPHIIALAKLLAEHFTHIASPASNENCVLFCHTKCNYTHSLVLESGEIRFEPFVNKLSSSVAFKIFFTT